MGNFLYELQDRTEVWKTPTLEIYLEAINEMAEPLVSIIEGNETLAEWGAILSPASFPDSESFTKPSFPAHYNPGYLGQFVGTSVPSQFDYAQAIALIKEEPNFARGTSEALIKAAARALKAGAVVKILSRQNTNGEKKPYWFVVVVRGADVEGSIATTGKITETSAKITGIPTTAGMAVGDPVIAIGFPTTATIKEVNSNTEITASTTATISTASASIVIVSTSGIQMLENNISEAKPAGLIFQLLYSGIYKELEEKFATYALLEAAYATYATLEIEA